MKQNYTELSNNTFKNREKKYIFHHVFASLHSVQETKSEFWRVHNHVKEVQFLF